MPFYVFDESGVSTFSRDWASTQAGRNRRHVVREVTVDVMPLVELLERHLPAGQAIDVLSVDVEGLDLEVLGSNDWGRFRPRFVVVEDFSFLTLGEIGSSPITAYLTAQGYDPIAATTASVVFKRRDVPWARLQFRDQGIAPNREDSAAPSV